MPGLEVLARAGEEPSRRGQADLRGAGCVYRAYLELHEHPAIFTAINADTMEIYTELVPFDAALAQRMSEPRPQR